MSGIVLGARGSGSPELASTTSWGLLEATGRRFRIRQAHRSARAARRHVPVRGRGVRLRRWARSWRRGPPVVPVGLGQITLWRVKQARFLGRSHVMPASVRPVAQVQAPICQWLRTFEQLLGSGALCPSEVRLQVTSIALAGLELAFALDAPGVARGGWRSRPTRQRRGRTAQRMRPWPRFRARAHR